MYNIYTLGIATIDTNSKARYVANYVNDKLFSDNVLSLIMRDYFNIRSGQSNVFTNNGMIYLFTGGDDNMVFYVVTKNGYSTRLLAKCTDDLKCYYLHYKTKGNKIDMELLIKICRKYDNPEEVDKLTKVQQKIESVKTVMQNNIDIAMQNCVKLEEMEKQTDELQHLAGVFKISSVQLKNKLWWKNMRMRIIIGVIVLIIIGIIVGVVVAMSQNK